MMRFSWYTKFLLAVFLGIEVWFIVATEPAGWEAVISAVQHSASDPWLTYLAGLWVVLGAGLLAAVIYLGLAVYIGQTAGGREMMLATSVRDTGNPAAALLLERRAAAAGLPLVSEEDARRLARRVVPSPPRLIYTCADVLPKVGMIGTLVGFALLKFAAVGGGEAALYDALSTAIHTSIAGLTASVIAEVAETLVSGRYDVVREALGDAARKIGSESRPVQEVAHVQ